MNNTHSEACDDPVLFDVQDECPLPPNTQEIEILRNVVSNLTRVHLLTTSRYDNFLALTQEYLLSGKEIFSLDMGIIIQFTKKSEPLIQTTESIAPKKHAKTHSYITSLCKRVTTYRQVMAVNTVEDQDTGYTLATFIGAPIWVSDTCVGTLSFYSEKNYKNISFHDKNLISLMAAGIGAFLLQEKEAHLTLVNEKIRRFVGYVAHDLRNPLGIIIGLTRIAKKENVKRERILHALERIACSAETALEFVNTILENAALSTGKISLNTQPTQSALLLANAIDDVRNFAEESDIKIHMSAPSKINVLCDQQRIHQTLVNLLINAVKYSPASSTVHLQTLVTETNCTFTIKNVIIYSEIASTSNNNNKLYGSVGFGLDIVKDILQAHHTELAVTAVKINMKSVFYCQFAINYCASG